MQEWWGVTDEIKRQAQYLHDQKGYRVLVPDLYKGKIGVDAEEASHVGYISSTIQLRLVHDVECLMQFLDISRIFRLPSHPEQHMLVIKWQHQQHVLLEHLHLTMCNIHMLDHACQLKVSGPYQGPPGISMQL